MNQLYKASFFAGYLLKTSELTGITNRLSTVSYASELEEGVVTPSLPLLESLPILTSWLVLHKQCFIDHTLLEEAKLRPENLSVIVSCIDKLTVPYLRDLLSDLLEQVLL
jgi:hypothetical protein